MNKAILFIGAGGLLAIVVLTLGSRRQPPEALPDDKPKKKPPVANKPDKPRVPGSEDKSTTLTAVEQVSLDNDPLALLAAWGMVSPHKVYVQQIAQKLAAAGDTRAADVNARVANWQGAVTYAGLSKPESDIVRNPIGFTLDQIFEMGSASEFPAFSRWAAEFLRANQRSEQADIITAQQSARIGVV